MSLKNLPFTVVLCLCGAALLFLALGGSFNGFGLSIEIKDKLFQVASGILGTLLIYAAIVIEFKTRPGVNISSEESDLTPEMEVVPSDIAIFSLDDHGVSQLSERLQNARQISMMMRSGVSLFSQYEALFISLINNGCAIRILLCDPESPVARTIYGGYDNSLKEYISTTENNLVRIANAPGTGKLEVRLVEYAPTLSMMLVEHSASELDTVQVSLFFTHSKYGRDRPTFILKHSNRWYNTFVKEYEAAWDAGKEWALPLETGGAGPEGAAP